MNRFEKAKIYKLTCKTTGWVYIGSTTAETLDKALEYYHVYNTNDYVRLRCSSHPQQLRIYHVLKNKNHEISLIENFPCENQRELDKRKDFFIRNTECVNKLMPDKDGFNQTKKEYRRENIKPNPHRSEKVECPCGVSVRRDCLNRHKKSNYHEEWQIKNKNV